MTGTKFTGILLIPRQATPIWLAAFADGIFAARRFVDIPKSVTKLVQLKRLLMDRTKPRHNRREAGFYVDQSDRFSWTTLVFSNSKATDSDQPRVSFKFHSYGDLA
jgi:hypothetical protein